MLSVIIPAHDEADYLPDTLGALRTALAALPCRSEVLVVDDGSTDATAEIALEQGARVLPVALRCIAAVRNAGARASRGERLLFLDADTRADAPVLLAAMAALDAAAVGGSAAVRFTRPLPLRMRVFEAVTIRLFRCFGITPGCFIFCRRDAFEAVGGFDETRFITEDVQFGRRLARHGRLVILREEVITSARKMHSHGWWPKIVFVLRFALRPLHTMRTRRGLELWYGPRRPKVPEKPSDQSPRDPGRGS